MIEWIIPDTIYLRAVNFWTLEQQKFNSNWFISNSKIKFAYGIFHDTILSGGRNTFYEQIENLADIESILEKYLSFGVSYRLVFTQKHIEENFLLDYWGNAQLKLVEKYQGGVIVASLKLAEYIKKTYPNLDIILSTTLLNSQEEFLTNLKNDLYTICVLNTQFNQSYDFIPQELRRKTEILVNDCCPPFCNNRLTCYGSSNAANLGLKSNFKGCSNQARAQFESTLGKNLYITATKKQLFFKWYTQKDIITAEQNGFYEFKLTGREGSPSSNLIGYAQYFIKPEYEKEFIIMGLFDLKLVDEKREALLKLKGEEI